MAEALGALIIASIPGGIGIGGAEALTIGGIAISASTVGTTALLAGSIGLSFALRQGPAPEDRTGGTAQISIRQPNPVRQGGYGRTRVAGSYVVYEATFVAVQVYWSLDVIALISGRIGGYKSFFLNDDAVTLSGQTVNQLPDGRYQYMSQFSWRIGLPRETVHANANQFLGFWTAADHRGDGIASIELDCAQSPSLNAQTKSFPNGLPSPSAVLDLYPIWDPRDAAQDPDDPTSWVAYQTYSAGTTYAAGDRVVLPALAIGAAYNGGTTYSKWAQVSSGGIDYFSRQDSNLGHTPGAANLAWWIPIGSVYRSRASGNIGNAPDARPDKWVAIGQNPVLQIIDYLLNSDYGMALDRATLITPALPALRDKADRCDDLVLDKRLALGPRYTSNGHFDFSDDPADVLGAIAATADIWFAEDEGGALALEVGVYSPPKVTFGERHILAFSVNYGVPDEQVVNTLELTFTDPASKYKNDIAGEPWANDDDIARRGRIRSQSLALQWVHRHSQARRLAKRAAARLAAPGGSMTLTLYGLAGLGQRWVGVRYPFLPEFADAVVELSHAAVDYAAGTVTFDWQLVDPATIDAWDPLTEEGLGPGEIAFNVIAPPSGKLELMTRAPTRSP